MITFNYDTLLERALDTVGKPNRLFPTRLKDVSEFGGIVDDSRDEVVVLKVHGSIDWFDRTDFERRIAWHEKQKAPPPEDIIFSHDKALGLERLIDGPHHNSDPLRNVYRARNLKALHAKNLLFRATPRMLPPSTTKLLYATSLNDFWSDMGTPATTISAWLSSGFRSPHRTNIRGKSSTAS
ncbi:hypothetical protein MesoLjLc_77120 [Mesorhizobium sp. L-8-10]|uniref:SIR2 family protein n=1 Tax=Mesorhizobium sp. L-8-10 TaxID=2744523 RepID=UPI001927113D|nr:SIR2 family protein [Mesorhizobium sp. L-8-10]BCH35782.1 hypothetical protein MesoLjLc_77120 [Mesorhizobium sp. L-8-10]